MEGKKQIERLQKMLDAGVSIEVAAARLKLTPATTHRVAKKHRLRRREISPFCGTASRYCHEPRRCPEGHLTHYVPCVVCSAERARRLKRGQR